MFRWLVDLIYGSTTAEFRSAYGLAESIARLQTATKRSVFSSLGETAAVGKVSESAVSLQRVIPMISNSFKPFFIGHFEVCDGLTVLIGRFTMSAVVKIFMTCWFGMLLLISGVIVLSGVKAHGSTPGFIGLQPLLMVGAGVALVAVGKWFARNDVAWLSTVIEGALGEARTLSATPEILGNIDSAAVPTPLKIASIVLAMSGVMQLLIRIFPSQLGRGAAASDFAVTMQPFAHWNEALAAGLLLLAVGVWQRRPWAWWGGFLLLGLSVLGPVSALRTIVRPNGVPVIIQIVFGGFLLVVLATWGRWWYAQRKHFLWT